METKNCLGRKKSAAEALLERRIAALEERAATIVAQITQMEESRKAFGETDAVGLAVTHRVFGGGKVIEQAQQMLTVAFAAGSRRFAMPAAFVGGFLETGDAAINEGLRRYRELGEEIRALREELDTATHQMHSLQRRLG